MQHKCNTNALSKIAMESYYPYVKPNYITKNDDTPVYIRYNYSRVKRAFIPVHISIDPNHWDFKRRKLKKACPDYDENEKDIRKLLNKISKIVEYANDQYIDPTIEFVLSELEKNRDYITKKSTLDIFELLDDFIKVRDGQVSKDTIKDYNSLKKHLKDFEDAREDLKITFKNFNKEFYNNWIEFLRFEQEKPNGDIGLKDNTIGKQIKNLKIFLRYLMDEGTIPQINLKPFKTITEETDAIFLDEEELKAIYELDYSDNKQYDQIRDVLIIGCYTGLRYGDLHKLRPEHIDKENELIQIKQGKVQRSVTIPFIDYVPEIMKKYNYELPKIHLNEFNKEIKKICKKAKINKEVVLTWKKGPKEETVKVLKKWELASSHICRRSFCTNMYLSGVAAEELMKISGHKSAAAFRRYIKVDNLQAALRLKEHRKNGKNN